MPLQFRNNHFLQYHYDPDYLRPKKYQITKSDPSHICDKNGIAPIKSSIVLDGGNIVKCTNKVILTSKIFKENTSYPELGLLSEVKNQLQVEHVIIIPQEPEDFTGHSDGMVRFVDNDTVLINKYQTVKRYKEFGYNFRMSLRNAGLRLIELPYTSWRNRDNNDATGCYINFLETGDYIFYPVFAQPSDKMAEVILRGQFKDRILVDIDCRSLAKLGGILHCMTWNILKN